MHDGSHWYLGLSTDVTFESLFRITDESKVVPSSKRHLHWRRRNGRLLRTSKLDLVSNICVS